MNIPIKYHCAFPGCIASAAVELDRFLGLPPEGWTYRLLGNLPDDYYCPEHPEVVEAEREREKHMEFDRSALTPGTGRDFFASDTGRHLDDVSDAVNRQD